MLTGARVYGWIAPHDAGFANNPRADAVAQVCYDTGKFCSDVGKIELHPDVGKSPPVPRELDCRGLGAPADGGAAALALGRAMLAI